MGGQGNPQGEKLFPPLAKPAANRLGYDPSANGGWGSDPRGRRRASPQIEEKPRRTRGSEVEKSHIEMPEDLPVSTQNPGSFEMRSNVSTSAHIAGLGFQLSRVKRFGLQLRMHCDRGLCDQSAFG